VCDQTLPNCNFLNFLRRRLLLQYSVADVQRTIQREDNVDSTWEATRRDSYERSYFTES